MLLKFMRYTIVVVLSTLEIPNVVNLITIEAIASCPLDYYTQFEKKNSNNMHIYRVVIPRSRPTCHIPHARRNPFYRTATLAY